MTTTAHTIDPVDAERIGILHPWTDHYYYTDYADCRDESMRMSREADTLEARGRANKITEEDRTTYDIPDDYSTYGEYVDALREAAGQLPSDYRAWRSALAEVVEERAGGWLSNNPWLPEAVGVHADAIVYALADDVLAGESEWYDALTSSDTTEALRALREVLARHVPYYDER